MKHATFITIIVATLIITSACNGQTPTTGTPDHAQIAQTHAAQATATIAAATTGTAIANSDAAKNGGEATSCKDAASLTNTVGSDNTILITVNGTLVQSISFIPQGSEPYETFAYQVKQPDGTVTEFNSIDYTPGTHNAVVNVTNPPMRITTLFALCKGEIKYTVSGLTQ